MPDLKTDYVAHDAEDSITAFNKATTEINSLRARVATLESSGGGGGGGGSGKGVGVIVASSQASTADKARAHYVATGSADQTPINLAVDVASVLTANARTANTGALGDASSQSAGAVATQAGLVQLTGGRFNIPAPINLRTGVQLKGVGVLTELRAVGNNGTGVIRLIAQAGLSDGSAAHLTKVSDLWIYGNWGSGGTCNGIDFDMSNSGNEPKTKGYPDVNPDSDHWIVDVLITGFMGGTRTGIKMHSSGTANCRGNMIRGCQIRDCSQDGIWLSAASDSYISECHVGGSGRYGYNIETGNTKLWADKSYYSGVAGFRFASGRQTISALEAQDDKIGILFDASPCTASSLTVDSCEIGVQVSTDRLVMTSVSVYNRTSGSNVLYNTTLKGIYFDATYADMMIIGQVDDAHTTAPVNGTVGARSFMRLSTGTSLLAV